MKKLQNSLIFGNFSGIPARVALLNALRIGTYRNPVDTVVSEIRDLLHCFPEGISYLIPSLKKAQKPTFAALIEIVG